MIAKNSDFVGRFYIANGQGNYDPNAVGSTDELSLFIEQFEPKCLVTVLGYSLYKELLTNLESDGTVSPGADQKWKDLVDGKDNYEGIKKVLTPYIYFYYLENDESHHTGVGVVKDKPKGAEQFSMRKKAVTAWREFYNAAVGMNYKPGITAKSSYLGTVIGVDYDAGDDDKYWSLYKFLDERSEDFPTANPSVVNNINTYGI